MSTGTLYDYPRRRCGKRFAALFGTEVKPVHQTITNFGYEFVYDKADAVYKIPHGMSPIYSPRVTDIERRAARHSTVAYIGGESWTQDKQGNFIPAEPDKYMSITLREVNGNIISALFRQRTCPKLPQPCPPEPKLRHPSP